MNTPPTSGFVGQGSPSERATVKGPCQESEALLLKVECTHALGVPSPMHRGGGGGTSVNDDVGGKGSKFARWSQCNALGLCFAEACPAGCGRCVLVGAVVLLRAVWHGGIGGLMCSFVG